MKLKPQTTILFSTFFVVVGIAITWATGIWQTESDKTPRKLDFDTVQIEAQKTQYDPADIRGSYTFGEISDLFGIPLTDLVDAFTLKEDEAAAFQVKSLEKQFSDVEKKIGTASVRMFTAYYLGIAYTPSEESYLPDTAVAILKEAGHMSAEQSVYLGSHTVSISLP